MDIRVIHCDYLIIGSGIAGLWTAIHLPADSKVAVVTKSGLRESNTEYAQGGIAVALCPMDTPELHKQDTLEAGAGLCDEPAVDVLTREGPEAVHELIDRGAQFDRRNGTLLYGREAAHRTGRIVHAHGDATGAEVERVAVEAVQGMEMVTTYEHTAAARLLIEDGECVGAEAIQFPSGQRLRFVASSTLVATGGVGALFMYTTNPPVATGDGMALALQAGCTMQDMEFVQFHPTALAAEGYPKFLISEAVRGEGAVLINNEGRAFMRDYHELADLAPRDVVSRAIHAEMRKQGGEYIRLDFSPIPQARIKERFPGILEGTRQRGFDPLREPVPVTPVAHYMMGGIACDLYGSTTIRRLFACGECANYGVHGANRLASNSLLDGLVFGKRAAGRMSQLEKLATDKRRRAAGRPAEPIAAGDEAWCEEIRRVMWEEIGIIRTGEGMREALGYLTELCSRIREEIAPSQAAMEAANMARVGRLIATAALAREESRGAHYRTDFPHPREEWRRHILITLQPGGSLGIDYRPVATY